MHCLSLLVGFARGLSHCLRRRLARIIAENRGRFTANSQVSVLLGVGVPDVRRASFLRGSHLCVIACLFGGLLAGRGLPRGETFPEAAGVRERLGKVNFWDC